MSTWAERIGWLLLLAIPGMASAGETRFGLGVAATRAQIAGWDIDVRPDGHGLPPGEGTAEQGEVLFARLCVGCHGEFGEGRGRFPALLGGTGTLSGDAPMKTVGSFWPYAPTLFDYLRRAQPFGHAQSLSDNETYALTAFLLNLNDLVDYGQVVDSRVLVSLKMPNHDGFVGDDRPDVPLQEPCMRECRAAPMVVGRAGHRKITPVSESVPEPTVGSTPQDRDGDAARGEQLFVRCVACHSLEAGEHGTGPSLSGILGRAAASAAGFNGYSAALRASDIVWTESALSRFLASPIGLVDGTSMITPGLVSRREIRDLVAYLRKASGR
jgi:cytochrome c